MSVRNDAPLVNPDIFPSWIIYEDEDLLVLDKPGWLVCHPSKNGPWSSLVGAVREYLGVESIHLVSRLDRETSGVVLFAKHRAAASLWQKGVESKLVKRTYLAILRGELKEGLKKVSTFIGKDPQSMVFVKQRIMEKTNKSKIAVTNFFPLCTRDEHTFCAIRTETGRKHQIRAHAQSIGHELVGEKLYGPDESIYLKFCESGWRDEWIGLLGMDRQALHGRSLDFKAEGKIYKSDLPDDMLKYMRDNLSSDAREIGDLVRKSDEIVWQD
ncbi:MAG: RluA family pseudouridine synthase [Verrucomicrobiota bacterium]|nr:RluA family pseudouridine synthase [Verrucomicrobiota bacterium]